MDDTLFNSLFVADESATVTEKSETTAWPIYPSENPTKAEKILWLQRFEYDARMSGYSASLRREDPFEIAKLASHSDHLITHRLTDPQKLRQLSSGPKPQYVLCTYRDNSLIPR